MSISFTPCLRKKLKLEKHGIINIRITANRKSTYVSLKEKIHERFWNDNTHQLRIHKDFPTDERDRLNELIENKIAELRTIYKASDSPDKTKSNSKLSFIDFLNAELAQLELRGKIGTHKRYKTTYYHLIKFIETKGFADLLFSQITTHLVRDFETYILSQKTTKGTSIKDNTSKNYVKCFKRLYHQALKLGVYTSFGSDPFVLFVNKRLPVENKRLNKLQVELIYQHQFEKTHPLFNTRNQFLFQIFCQGLRVSDLFTLRFENINRPESRIEFHQFKTKKPNSILINNNLLLILKDYIEPDLTSVLNEKYAIELLEGKIENLNYYEMGIRYEEITRAYFRQSLETQDKVGFIPANETLFEKVEKMKERLNKYFMKITYLLNKGLVEHAVKHPKDFIFPVLKNEDFQDVVFDQNTRLSRYQYNQLQSKEVLYNRNLKKIQAFFNISLNLTSHISRHTYASMLFDMDPKGIYEISKGLGHTNIRITENYLKSFDAEIVDAPNVKFNDTFTHLKITQAKND